MLHLASPAHPRVLSPQDSRGESRLSLAVGRTTEKEASMLGRKEPQKTAAPQVQVNGHSAAPITLLTVIGETAKMEGKFEIADSIQIECEVGGELRVGGKLVIGEKGVVNANVETVDAIIMGHYDGNMTASGNVEIAATGRVTGEIPSNDTLIIGEKGVVSATIRAGIVLVSGEVVGNIIASERVELRGTARVFGDVEAPVIVVEEGVLFEGHCRMTKGRPGDQPAVVTAPPQRDLSIVSLKR